NNIVLGNYASNNSLSEHEIALGGANAITLFGNNIVGSSPAVFTPIEGCYYSGVGYVNQNTGAPPAAPFCQPAIPGLAGNQQPAGHVMGRTVNADVTSVFASLESVQVDADGDGRRDLTIAAIQSGRPGTNGNNRLTVALKPELTNVAVDASDGVDAGSFDARGEDRFVDLGAAAAPSEGLLRSASNPLGVADLGTIELETLTPESGIVDPLVVTTLSDTVYQFDHLVSLREAIHHANATAGVNTITFDSSLTGGTITLVDHDADGQGVNLEITDDVVIDASSISGITIDANNLDRIFHFSATTGSLSLDSLTLTNGQVADGNGGAILFESTGSLNIDHSQITGNSTTGAAGHGGGVYATGTVNVSSSAIFGNSTTGASADGGGLFAATSANVTNSTIYGNTAISESSRGGAISANTLTLTNATISGNEASNGGGVQVASAATINNSLLLGNLATVIDEVGHEINGAAVLTFGGHNLVGIDGVAFEAEDPSVENATLLDVFADGTLADNGGIVATMALKPSTINPALDAGNDSLLSDALDARGATRKANLPGIAGSNQIDLGAFELQATETELPSLVVTTTQDVVDDSDFATSLREAILFANDVTAGVDGNGDADNDGADNDTISFVDFGGPATIQLVGQLSLTSSMTIAGPGADELTISGAGTNQRIFDITDFSSSLQEVAIRDITLADAGRSDVAHFGGAILNRENLSLIDSAVTGNSATFGGGVYSTGQLLLSGTAISNNTSSSDGGGLFLGSESTTTIVTSHVSGNTATRMGGGLEGNGALTVEDSTFSANSGERGGGIYLQSSSNVSVRNTTFSGNTASTFGGGLASLGPVTAGSSIENSTFTGNRATVQAGGLFHNSVSQLELHNSLVAG
ncbi:MAG: choice-of-anchor Q domain-containing protein, partial [Planctomycetota bacterium]